MTEYVVKHIGLFAVGDLLGGAEEIGGGKTPVREMLEKGSVRNPAGHRDDLPPRNGFQQRVELSEIGDARLQLAEDIEAIEESAARIAIERRRLPIEQASPGFMLLGSKGAPLLRHRPIGRDTFGRCVENMCRGHSVSLQNLRPKTSPCAREHCADFGAA